MFNMLFYNTINSVYILFFLENIKPHKFELENIKSIL